MYKQLHIQRQVTPDDERYIRSKHVQYTFRINTYKKVRIVGLAIQLIAMHVLCNIKLVDYISGVLS